MPPVFSALIPHPRIIHSSVYAPSIDAIISSINNASTPDRAVRIGVVGSGQSSAEVLLDLHDRLNIKGKLENQKYQVDLIFRRGSFKPSDDTPFSNEIFDPSGKSVNYLYSAVISHSG